MSSTATATPLREQVATEVRRELAAARMTPTELARRLGVSQTTVWRRISGEVAFDVDDLQKIADILGVPVGRLLPRSVQTTEPYLAATVGQDGLRRRVATRPIDSRPNGHMSRRSTRPGVRTSQRANRLRGAL
jgi:transcriptional regulator with XRE-family HTH domain